VADQVEPSPERFADVDTSLGAAATSAPVEEDWEPGLPPLRSIAPSVIGGAAVPLAVYYIVRSHVGSDADALAIAGIPASIWVLSQFIRKHRVDAIGAIVLFGFIVGLVVSFALGGNAFVLKVRDSGFTFLFGLTSVVTTRFGRRPVIFYIGRGLSAGTDPVRIRHFDELWELPPARALFKILGLLWGFGLMIDAGVRIALAADLSTKSFLAVSPVASFVFIGAMAAATFALVTRARARGPLVDPATLPAGGGGTLWWLRVFLVPPSGLLAERQPEG